MRIPAHIGLIPDGNRRWANSHGLEKQFGYQHGLNPGLQALKLAQEYKIKELTYYGFTADNCKRPTAQIKAFSDACVEAVEMIANENVSLLVVGNTNSVYFPKELLQYTTRKDMNGGGIKVNFLVNYGWEWDLANYSIDGLQSHDVSRIDMIIRWGGMRRLSGLLPVQSVYADFFIIDKLWPDFSPQDFHDAIAWYQEQDVTLGG
ncbi:MAG: undecaprenyl diphosphate synthase family protein [Oscillospiraceae bacterium]